MGLKDFLIRMRNMFNNPERIGTPISPNEMELSVYLKRERDQKLKKVLDHYRKKERHEFLQGDEETNILSQPPTLVDMPKHTGELKTKQQKRLRKHSRLINQGSGLFFK